jgi:hypothetical protein
MFYKNNIKSNSFRAKGINLDIRHHRMILQHQHKYINILLVLITVSLSNCKKLIQISPPVSTITTPKVFSTDGQANAATVGIYSSMMNIYPIGFGSGAITIYSGLSSDELKVFDQTSGQELAKFQANTLSASSGIINSSLWSPAYFYIYSSNAIISNLLSSTTINDSVKKELTGEAKFIRAFCYFYLTNLFGDIPLVTSTDWNKTELLSRTSSQQIYAQIISDLKDAQSLLSSDYAIAGGERIRPNKWAATALLSRIYLYGHDWQNAETQASAIINNASLYALDSNINDIFLSNSREAIWQLQQNSGIPPYNGTPEGGLLIPYSSSSNPLFYLTDQLLNAFEEGDKRKKTWLDSTIYSGITYYFPRKYTIGPAEQIYNGPIPQYYTMLRMAEQYLIRAESRAQLGKITDAASDLNAIRNRAGLPNTTSSMKDPLLNDIIHERQIELFSEWGHRWFDLKRLGIATTTLSPIKPDWNTNAQLYPLPLNELKTDPNLTQNPGY